MKLSLAFVASCYLLLTLGIAMAAEPPASRPAEPFRGAFMHIEQIVGKASGVDGQRAALAAALNSFKASGLRVAMPYVKDTGGGALYESKVVPVRRYKDRDMLADFMLLAKERGIAVWPVICVVTSGGETGPPAGILVSHPEWALRDKDGKPIGCVSPCNAKAREWMVAMVGEVVRRYGPEGVLLDYLRFPSSGTVQLDAESAGRLEKEYRDEKSATPEKRKEHLLVFKRRELTELARAISEELRRQKPGVRIGIYTWGPQVLEGHNVAQDWRTWAARGYVDMVSVSGYCYRDNFGNDYLNVFEKRMSDAVKAMKEAGGRAELTLCLGVKTSHGQVHSAEEIGMYRKLAQQLGIKGVAVFTWSYLQPYLAETVQAGYLK